MIRKATIADVPGIHTLLKYYGDRGELLARPLSGLYDHLRDFTVYTGKNPSEILGCCALQFCWEEMAEIRSLAVNPGHLNEGIGAMLVEKMFAEAREYGIRKIFTLTYQPDFFQKFGFSPIDRSDLPIKIWTDCITCVKFPDCDETAMIKILE